jgi:hypothetical protein
MKRALLILMVVAAAGPARGQDAATQEFYAKVERRIHAEYRMELAQIAQVEIWPSLSAEDAAKKQERIARAVHTLKIFAYNKATQMADCAAEAASVHSPMSPPVPTGQNLMLQTCIEAKLELLRKFANTSSYAARFFPERIEPCEKRARLPDREQSLPPYAFLQLDEPKLYDFELYNQCLMTVP